MKKTLCSILLLMVIPAFYSLQAQILNIPAGTNIVIKQGTAFVLDSLILTPSSDFTLTNISIMRNSVVTFPAVNQYIARVYKFSGSTDAFTGSIRMIYQDGAELNGLAENTLQLNVHDGAGWQSFNAATNDDINNYVLTQSLSGIQLNELTLASSSAPLPLLWRSFIAAKQPENVLLKWSTYSEQNTKYFTVQSSVNGTVWNSLAAIAAAGSSASASNYSYLDVSAVAGYNYYRIVETDIDGKQNYSIVQKIFIESSQLHIELLGNPVTNGMLMVRVNVARANDKAPTLNLYTNDGRLVQKIQAVAGINNIKVSGYAKGTYFLQANSITIKFLIQ
ncbi:MAG: hypothetical protein ABIN97_12415 [Ginsengibacter sp.]